MSQPARAKEIKREKRQDHLSEIEQKVRRDAQVEAEQYALDSEVPEGGE